MTHAAPDGRLVPPLVGGWYESGRPWWAALGRRGDCSVAGDDGVLVFCGLRGSFHSHIQNWTRP